MMYAVEVGYWNLTDDMALQLRDFLLRENPQAAAAIAERLDGARRRGVWHPRRNDVDAGLAALRAEVTA